MRTGTARTLLWIRRKLGSFMTGNCTFFFKKNTTKTFSFPSIRTSPSAQDECFCKCHSLTKLKNSVIFWSCNEVLQCWDTSVNWPLNFACGHTYPFPLCTHTPFPQNWWFILDKSVFAIKWTVYMWNLMPQQCVLLSFSCISINKDWCEQHEVRWWKIGFLPTNWNRYQFLIPS